MPENEKPPAMPVDIYYIELSKKSFQKLLLYYNEGEGSLFTEIVFCRLLNKNYIRERIVVVMTNRRNLQVYSEIGRLKTVLLHRPGREIENVTPDLLERLLFDDIPFLEIAQQEHDAFAQILRDNGVEVLYLEELAAESLTTDELKHQFVDEFIEEANVEGEKTKALVKEMLLGIDTNLNMVIKMMEGIEKAELYGRF